MPTPLPSDLPDFNQLIQKIFPGSTLLRAWPLQGGVSAQVTALEMQQADGQARKLVVRQHGAADLHQNPHIAADEFKLLQFLHAAGIPVPSPIFADESGTILPTPYIVIEFMEGSSDDAPSDTITLAHQLATHLAGIHTVADAPTALAFPPSQTATVTQKLQTRPAHLDDSLSEGRIRDTLEPVWPLPQRNPTVLLHGDYWPGNILWKADAVAAILDWEDAALGDPLADVANARLELLWAFGPDALHHFTQHYQSFSPFDFTNLPYWDLYAALRPASKLSTWGLDAPTEQSMRDAHRWFIEQAIEKIQAEKPTT